MIAKGDKVQSGGDWLHALAMPRRARLVHGREAPFFLDLRTFPLTTDPSTGLTYAQAGVSIAAGNALGGINVWRLRGGAGGEGDAPVQPPLLVPAPEPPSAVLALAALKRHGSKDVDDSACVLAGGYADGFVRVWKLKHAGVNLIAAFEAHTGGGCSLVASALTGDTAKRRLQDVLLVSGGDDGALRVWTVRLSSGAAEQLWADLYAHLGAAVTSLAWHTSHDGSTAVVSGGADGTVQLWRLHGLASAGGGLLPSGVLQDAGLERVGSLAGTGNGRIVAIAPSEARIRAASTTAVSSLLEVDTLVVSMSVTAAPPGQRIAAVAAVRAPQWPANPPACFENIARLPPRAARRRAAAAGVRRDGRAGGHGC